MSFQVRASDDYTNMGVWSDTLSSPSDLEGILIDDDSYFQYRAIMETAYHGFTPILNDVTISWDPVSIGETTEPISPAIALLPISPNPSAGSPVVRFVFPEPRCVSISILDLSGRLISQTHGRDYSGGYHNVQILEELSPGVYFCRMTSGDFAAVQRFVVIE
ncbi:MAG: T9SS type A sorting domain-containing protein [Candidatus Sabulitectum sp.]|nr:T9SS type A sorting domain-containing protein [Candidatus Sabulitectum sp.]